MPPCNQKWVRLTRDPGLQADIILDTHTFRDFLTGEASCIAACTQAQYAGIPCNLLNWCADSSGCGNATTPVTLGWGDCQLGYSRAVGDQQYLPPVMQGGPGYISGQSVMAGSPPAVLASQCASGADQSSSIDAVSCAPRPNGLWAPIFDHLPHGPSRPCGHGILLDLDLHCFHPPALNPGLPAARFTPYLPNGVSPFQYNVTTTNAVMAAAPAPGGSALLPVATPSAGQSVPTSQDNANAAFRGQQVALGGPLAAAPAPAPAASVQTVASSSFGGGCDCSLPTVYNAAAPDLALQLIFTGACGWDRTSGCPNGTYGSGNKGGQHHIVLQQQSATAAC